MSIKVFRKLILVVSFCLLIFFTIRSHEAFAVTTYNYSYLNPSTQAFTDRLNQLPINFNFVKNLKRRQVIAPDVVYLKWILNSDSRTALTDNPNMALTALNSSFGPLTENAVKRFQTVYRSEILDPQGIQSATGIVGNATRQKLNWFLGESRKVVKYPTSTYNNIVNNNYNTNTNYNNYSNSGYPTNYNYVDFSYSNNSSSTSTDTNSILNSTSSTTNSTTDGVITSSNLPATTTVQITDGLLTYLITTNQDGTTVVTPSGLSATTTMQVTYGTTTYVVTINQDGTTVVTSGTTGITSSGLPATTTVQVIYGMTTYLVTINQDGTTVVTPSSDLPVNTTVQLTSGTPTYLVTTNQDGTTVVTTSSSTVAGNSNGSSISNGSTGGNGFALIGILAGAAILNKMLGGGAASAVGAAAGGAASSVGTQTVLSQFGGRITLITPCTCGGNAMITLFDLSLKIPLSLIFQPGVSTLKMNYNPTTGQNVLGGYVRTPATCMVYVGSHCNPFGLPVGIIDTLRGIGTTLSPITTP